MLALAALIFAVWFIAAAVARAFGWRPPAPTMRVLPPVRRRPARAPVRADVPHALYDYLHAHRPGRIYIGISNEPEVRHSRHGVDPKDQWWYRRSTGVMHVVAWYPNRWEAQAAERERVYLAAMAGEDIANDHHNPIRRPRRVYR